MKSVRTLFTLATVLIFSGAVFAQIESINLEKMAFYQQTDGSTVTLKPFIPNPTMGQPPLSHSRELLITVETGEESPSISGMDRPEFTIPGGSYNQATDGGDHGKLFYDPMENRFIRSFAFGPMQLQGSGGPPGGTGVGGIDGLFNNGTYTLTVDGNVGSLNLGGIANADLYPDAPLATVTGGTWVGGKLRLNPMEAFSASLTFAGFETNGALVNHLSMTLRDSLGNIVGGHDVESFSSEAPAQFDSEKLGDTVSFNHTFTSAGMYFVDIEMNAITDINTTDFGGALAVALFTNRSFFAIEVIPEPSTYAAIFGGLALIGVMIHRRRQMA